MFPTKAKMRTFHGFYGGLHLQRIITVNLQIEDAGLDVSSFANLDSRVGATFRIDRSCDEIRTNQSSENTR